MSETVVHVTTLDQWNSVLDIWFKQGYSWYASGTEYKEWYFRDGNRFLLLDNDNDIITPSHLDRKIIEYSEFIAQQKEDKEVKTYYVNKKKLTIIQKLKTTRYPLHQLLNNDEYYSLNKGLGDREEKALLRYLGGDETIEFKVKEQLYRLWRIDDNGDKVYLEFMYGTPAFTRNKELASNVSLNETQKWINPAWKIEKAD